ncbi:hypothetical protein ACOSP7_004991 [Xanthoceras sorbifolium]
MAVNSSTHYMPPLNRPLSPSLPLPFFNRNSYILVSYNKALHPRVLFVKQRIQRSEKWKTFDRVSEIENREREIKEVKSERGIDEKGVWKL